MWIPGCSGAAACSSHRVARLLGQVAEDLLRQRLEGVALSPRHGGRQEETRGVAEPKLGLGVLEIPMGFHT